MAYRIRRFGPGQTAKVMGVLYALMGLVFLPFLLLAVAADPGLMGIGLGFAVIMPILYGVFGAIAVAIGCALYNLVAGWVGGVEIELEGDEAA